MLKKVYITNGMARSGKDTLASYMNDFIPTLKFSSIDRVKEVALQCGWNGEKDEKGRSFLSDLKDLLTEYYDFPFESIKEKYNEFLNDDKYSVLLVDIREPAEIEKAVKEFKAKSILVENNRVEVITSNSGDAGVFNYSYDYIIKNNGTLAELKATVKQFVEEVVLNG